MERFLYPLTPPARRRDPATQMQVLCLGLSRSGTDSLRNSLEILGYNGVYHGFVITARQREDCAFWVPLMRQKLRGHSSQITDTKLENINFDSVLGNVEAVTDGPANVFSHELMAYYPDAKVILNRRRDIDGWYASMEKNCLEVFSWPMWILSWFDTSICWLWWNFDLVMRGYYGGDFKANGKRIAVEHYQVVEKSLKSSGRPYLDWSVDQGWEPLCEFLGKPVPKVAFPDGNKGSGQFQDNMEEATKDIVKNSLGNMGVSLAVCFKKMTAAFDACPHSTDNLTAVGRRFLDWMSKNSLSTEKLYTRNDVYLIVKT